MRQHIILTDYSTYWNLGDWTLMRRMASKISGSACVVAILFSPAIIAAQVVTDGSLGPAVTLDGADIEVGQALGARVGDNLFHSFDRFSVAADQQVTFTGDESIGNVISRVTGGEVSTIAGALRSEVGAQGFFFINPSGVIIEESASIDVPAALHVSNATSIRFDDGSEWSTGDSSDATLTIAAPEAFGFLGASATGVHINGAGLEVAEGATLDVVGVNVAIEDAAIAAPNGQVRAQAAGASGPVPAELLIGTSDGDLTIANSSFSGENASILFGGGAVGFDGAGAGATDFNGAPSELLIAGAQIDLSGVTFSLAPNDADAVAILALTAAGDINIGGFSELLVSGDVAGTDTETLMLLNAGGNIAISGGSVLENDGGADELGGQFFVQAVDMTLDDGASIISDTTSGVGGLIDIRLRNLSLNGFSTIAASATEDGGLGGAIGVAATGVVALDSGRISASALGGADGGLISIMAPRLTLANGAFIDADIFGDGAAGAIGVDVGDLTLSGGSFISTDVFEDGGTSGFIDVSATGPIALSGGSFISSSSAEGREIVADGGFIQINAGALLLEGGSSIATNVFSGQAGAITANTGAIALTEGSRISSNASSAGFAGDLTITTGDLALLDGSRIASTGAVDAGSGFIQINAGALLLEGGSSIATNVFSGQAGAITANIGAIALTEGSRISSNASSAGFAGDLTITTGDLALLDGSRIASTGAVDAGSGFINLTADNIAMTNGAAIASDTGAAEGGAVTITATSLRLGDDRPLEDIIIATEIAADSLGGGDAGFVAISVADLVNSNSEISADTFSNGDAGGVRIEATNSIILSGRAEAASRSEGGGAAGGVLVSAPLLVVERGAVISSEATGASDSGFVTVTADDLRILNGGRITSDVVDGAGGLVFITAGDLLIVDEGLPEFSGLFTEIAADSEGVGQAGSVSVSADRMLVQSGFIVADSFGEGAAGDVNVVIADEMIVTQFGQIASISREGLGDAGDVTISAPLIDLNAGGSISTEAVGAAAGGQIVIDAGSLSIRNGAGVRSDVINGEGGIIDLNVGVLSLENDFLPEFDGVFTEVSAETFGAGVAGSIEVDARSIRSQGGFISTDSQGTGDAGDVTLLASRNVRLAQGGARSNAVAGLGNAGAIFVDAPLIRLNPGGQITTSATGVAESGIITLEGQDLILNGGGVTSVTTGSGLGGDIAVGFDAPLDTVTLRNGGEISASSLDGGGPAGLVTIEAREILLTGGSEVSTVSRGAPLDDREDAERGQIEIDASLLTIRGGASITAEGSELGDGGDIEINADDVLVTGMGSSINSSAVIESNSATAALSDDDVQPKTGDAGSIKMTMTTLNVLNEGSITTKAEGGAGGEIVMKAANEIILNEGDITTSVTSGEENGGNVTITVDDGFIVLHQGSEILSQAVGGNGGVMQINMDALYRSRSTRIDASSELGFDGPVVISGLENPETAEAGVLPSDFLDANAVVRNPCLAAFLGRSQLQIVETGVSAGSIQGDSPLLDAATAGGLTLVGGDLSANAAGCDG